MRRSSPRTAWQAARPALLAALCLALGACSVGPKYKRPAAPAPPTFKELTGGNNQWKTAKPSDGKLKGDWWEMFSDPQLNALEQKVAISNQNVKQAEAQFRQARALVAYNHSGYFPTISVTPSVSVSGGQPGFAGRGVTATSSSSGVHSIYDLPFGVSWVPNLWGSVTLAVENASALAQASAAQLENMKLSMQADLASDYFAMQALDMEEGILDATIGDYQQALKLTQARFNNGIASRADVVAAEAQLDAAEASRTDLVISRQQYEHAIAVLTGQPPSNLTLPAGSIKSPPPPIPTGFPSQLLERRPDIAAAERDVAAANAQIGLARVAYFPSLSISGSAGFESSTISQLFTWPSHFWSIGPTLSETLLDFGRRRAQNAQAQAYYDAQVAAYRQTVLNGFQEVEDNLVALKQLSTESRQEQAAVNAAEDSVRLETELYKNGVVSYLDVITAQATALTDQRAAVQILGRRMTASVQLILALGGGWNASMLPTGNALRSLK
jgi:NodT family efflux transporter outer membrane factor (OMF) lipoprotein